MELAGYRRMFRVLFFIGAMIACFGLGLYEMDMKLAGVLLLIFGIAMLVICFGITRFFILLSVQVSKKPKIRDEEPEDDKNDLQVQ